MPNFPIPEHNNRPPRKRTVVKGGSSIKPALVLPRTATSVYHLPAQDMRRSWCDICHNLTEIQFRDVATGHNLGACCLPEMMFADRLLDQVPEVRRPQLNEAKQLDQ